MSRSSFQCRNGAIDAVQLTVGDDFFIFEFVPDQPSEWTFLTNHAHVLFCVAQDPEIRLRDVAEQVGITERAVQRIVTELEESGYITRQRSGRRNLYVVHHHRPLRHRIESHRQVGDLLALVVPQAVTSRASSSSAPASS
jgi:DeoR/GlpR family transcriptional regulator of sugar metabolism